jgi:hypothetical protein
MLIVLIKLLTVNIINQSTNQQDKKLHYSYEKIFSTSIHRYRRQYRSW